MHLNSSAPSVSGKINLDKNNYCAIKPERILHSTMTISLLGVIKTCGGEIKQL